MSEKEHNLSHYHFSKAKRSLDICFAVLLLFVLIIVFPFVWLLNFVDDRGPMFFLQKRVGLGGNLFTLIKLRTLKSRDDTLSFTIIGRILRKTHIDEFPQSINILKGVMSAVGPRPYVESECAGTAKYLPNFSFRHNVKPGITGLAQVHYEHNNDQIEVSKRKLHWDLIYVEKASLKNDIQILCKSFGSVTVGKGR